VAELKQSTARVRVFKMIDSADHFSKKTGLTCAVNLSKNGGAFGAAGGAVAEIANGWYSVSLTTTDTNTLGDLAYYITAAGADDTDFCDQVTTQILGDTLTANTTQLAGQTVTAAAGVTFPSSVASPTNITAATGIVLSGVTHAGAVIPTVTTVTNQLTAAQIATGVWQDATAGDFTTASSIGKSLYTSGAVPGAANGLFIAGSNAATTVNFTGNLSGSVGSVTGAVGSVTGAVGSVTGAVGSVTAGVTVTTNNDKTGYGLSAAAVQAVWDALTSALTTVGSIGKLIVTNLDALISSRMATYTQPTGFLAATFPATVASTTNITAGTITTVSGNVTGSVGSVTGAVGSVTGNVGGNVVGSVASVTASVGITAAAVDLIWDEPTAGHATAGTTGKALIDAGSAGDPWSTELPGAYGAGTAGKLLGDSSSNVTSIKAKTDSLTYTVAGQVDANIQSVNDTTVTGNGSVSTPWGP